MLKIDNSDGGMRIEMEGNLVKIVAELSSAINAMYNRLYKQSPLAAAEYKALLIRVIGDPTSPQWDKREVGGEGITVVIPYRQKDKP